MNKNTTIGKIINYQREGYLFHGSSTAGISELKPHASFSKNNSDSFSNDTAVYACTDPTAAMIYGLIPTQKNITWYQQYIENKTSTIIPHKYKVEIEKAKGYIYVLDKKDFIFDDSGFEAKSLNPVHPVDVVEISFTDFLDLGGRVEWNSEINKENPIWDKFDLKNNLVKEYRSWMLLVRNNHVKLGSCVAILKRDAYPMSEITEEEMREYAVLCKDIERALGRAFNPHTIHHLALSWFDKQIHFHIIPRYNGNVPFANLEWEDDGDPNPLLQKREQISQELLNQVKEELIRVM